MLLLLQVPARLLLLVMPARLLLLVLLVHPTTMEHVSGVSGVRAGGGVLVRVWAMVAAAC